MYLGHGGGVNIINDAELNRIKNLDNVILLMGCASARLGVLDVDQELRRKCWELDGICYDFLSSDCKVLFGNLWSVGGGDLDMITEGILRGCFGKDGRFDVNSIGKVGGFKG